ARPRGRLAAGPAAGSPGGRRPKPRRGCSGRPLRPSSSPAWRSGPSLPSPHPRRAPPSHNSSPAETPEEATRMDETKYGFWFPQDVSVHGRQIDQLIDIVHWFMLILFVGWGIFFVYCLIKYRARPGHAATYLPPKAQFTKVIETAVIVIEVALLFGFSTPVWFRYKNHPPAEKDALVVKLVAEQFAWNFHYSGKDGKFGKTSEASMSGDNPLGMDPDDPDGKDDIVTVNQFHVPVGKDVIVQISSKDVIHSFNIPVLRVKQDAVP